jgi:hypothetical protein
LVSCSDAFLALPGRIFVGYEPRTRRLGNEPSTVWLQNRARKAIEAMIRGISSAVDGVAAKAAYPRASASSALSGLLLLSRP